MIIPAGPVTTCATGPAAPFHARPEIAGTTATVLASTPATDWRYYRDGVCFHTHR
jgi:hypothetical protein